MNKATSGFDNGRFGNGRFTAEVGSTPVNANGDTGRAFSMVSSRRSDE